MKFYKTRIVFEVLHTEDVPLQDWELWDIVKETIEGNASGQITEQTTVELDRIEARQALIAQGSDPTFLEGE